MISPTSQGPPTTILLVDDEALVRNVLAAALEDRGYRVITATDGTDAWKLLQADGNAIHAIIADVKMPRMDGLNLDERVSTLPAPPPLIFISGYPRGDVPIDRPFLPKPFRTEELVALISQLLSGREPAVPAESEAGL